MITFSQADKRAAAEREANMRRRVYDRLVANGKMTRPEADRGIAVMMAIADDYRPAETQGALTL